MRTELRLSFLLITTLLFINTLNGQITYINPPADTTVTCDNFIAFPGDIETEDDCPGDSFVFFDDETTRVNDTDTCAFYNYVVTRTFSAMNSCADTVKYVQTITVIDTTAPIFTPPPAVTVSCSQLDNLEITGGVEIFADECGGTPSRAYVDEVKPLRCDSTITRTWIVTDLCGNFSTGTQLITVIDDEAPFFVNTPRDISVMCSMTENPYAVFNDWVDNIGYANYDDQCNNVNLFFAAVPGTYDLQDPATFPGDHPAGLNPPECGVVDGAIQFEEVDFIIVDACGNAAAESATFYYIDDVFPVLGDCEFDVTVNIDGSACTTSLTYEVPTAVDSCAMENLQFLFTDMQDVSSSAPGDPSVVVDDLEFRLGPYGPQITFTEENFFTITMTNVDGEGLGETFSILDEDDILIGTTPNTETECASLSFELGPLTKEQMEGWAQDDFINFTLRPTSNDDPEQSVNDVCSFSTIEISQLQILNSAADSVQMFFGLDEDPFVAIFDSTIEVSLDAGVHIVKFMAVDCAGNSTTCPQRVTVLDNSAPQLNCGVSRQVDTEAGICGFPLPLSEVAIINNPCLEDINIDVEVQGAMTALYQGDYETMKDSMVLFPVGTSIIAVSARDFSGNLRQCNFNIEVTDNELPNAICETVEIAAVAIELENFTVDPMALAGNSTDNCGIRDIIVENNEFSCGDIGEFFTKTVLVRDESDNISTCNGSFALIERDIPITYEVGICPSDSLLFFLNIPIRSQYVFDWDGPLGFSSVLAEPFIPSVSAMHEGLYTVTARNVITGCESSASIEVFVDDVRTPTLTTEAIGCETIPHLVSTDSVPGDDITYEWYKYIDDLRFLLATTETPFAEIPLEPGDYLLGSVVRNSICTSIGSNREAVEIRGRPDGAICTELIEGCIGMPLVLCVDDPEEQFIIRWSGPEGFISDEAMPVVTDSFTQAFSGVYKLVIEDNLCITDTLTTSVTTNVTPGRPEILGDRLYCPGDSLKLTSSVTGPGYVYIWDSPAGTFRNNQPTLVIINTEPKFNGEWRLSVENGPCLSDQSDPITVDIEGIQNFFITTDDTQCEGAQVTLTSNGLPESMYEWTGPGGFTSSAFNPTVPIQNGTYTVRNTTRNGCEYVDQVVINTVTLPQILSVSVSEEGPCINPNTPINILANLSEAQDILYEWTGPNVSSTSSSLFIDNFTIDDIGVYSVRIYTGACESELFTFPLSYIISPAKPVLDTDPIACIGDSLILTTEDFGPEAVYEWVTPDGNVVTNESKLGLGDVTTSLSGSYGVKVTVGECESEFSDLVDITVNENTFVPNIIASGEECLQSAYQLFADLSGDLDMEWELPDGSLVISDTLNFSLQVSDAGTYRVRSLSNGCPSAWSTTEVIDVADPREGLALASDFLFSCNNDDSGLEFCVDNTSGLSGVTYSWFLGGQLIGESTSTCYQVEDPSIFSFGINEVSLMLTYNGCVVNFDETLILEIENVRDINTFAGNDQFYCIGDGLIMNADEVSTNRLSAFWTVESGVDVDDINDPMATITILEDLDSTFAIWNVDHIECGVVYRDTVVLRQKTKPQTLADTLVMDSQDLTFNPLENDILVVGNNYEITETSDPRWGDASISGESISFIADPKFIGGPINFTYTVCDDACETLCNTGEIVLLYNAESCKGNNVLTPNNDGSNDKFVIPCVENLNLPESSLVILNELGNTIYEQAPYDNTWDGTFNGEPLAEGTYYYIFRRDNEASVVQGFISIER